MPKQIRVNVSTKVNNANIKTGERNGRKVITVPSATLPFNVVMNGGLYPEDEIRDGHMTLEKTLAPIGHPFVNGQYVSSRDPEAINSFHVGAWNENVRIEGNRVKLDKIIDVERAEQTESGRALLSAINENKPIHTSTGLLLEREEVQNNDGYDWIARNMIFDHDAILLNEPGAATPDQGVGMMVNSDGEEIEVQNVRVNQGDELPNSFEDFRIDLMKAVEDKYGNAWVEDFNETSLIFHAERFDHESRKVSYTVADGEITIGDDIEPVQRKTTWEAVNRLFQSVKSMLNFKSDEAAGLSVNHDEGNEMPITEEQFKALEGKVDKLVANASEKPVAEQITEAVTAAVKPIQDQLTANAEAEKAKAKAEHEAAVNKVVEAEILEKEVAETMDTVALNALAEKFGKPGEAFGVNGSFKGPKDPNALSTDLPGGE